MRILIVACLALLAACPAWAQIDPDPDGIGIYADMGATLNVVEAPVGQALEVYVLITRSSSQSWIGGWQCGFGVPDNVVIWGWVIPGNHINVGNATNFVVGLAAPLPIAPVVHLMTLILVVVDEEPGFFTIRDVIINGNPYPPAYVDYSDELVPLHAWPSGLDMPALAFNGADITPVDALTFDQVKALFR